MTLQRQALFWTAAFLALAFFLYLFSGILLPFVAGLALAYLLDPVADRLETFGVPRVAATILILASVVLVIVFAIVLIAPVLFAQLSGFIERLPETVARLQELLATQGDSWLGRIVGQGLGQAKASLGAVVSQGVAWITSFLGSLWASGQAIMSVVSLLVVTPVVAFYMLIDWDRMVGTIDAWTPRRHKEEIRQIAREMDESIAGFVRGQALVCLILGTFYAIALTLVGLNFGLVIGLSAGLIGFIPYVGSLTGLILSVGVAIVQFWPDWTIVALVLGIFVVGQFVEGNILQPRLVGRSVGLHPVWLMFALVAFGYLMGFVGLLVAVPLAAAVGVLVRFAVQRYLESPFYTGEQGPSVLPGGQRGAGLFAPHTRLQKPEPPAAPPESS
ncbi:AI-2E family transporter [Hansschlegelia plantiphila]|uniref:AI-2E family transporter n=1 Tax=Hansschlegelia plantiphila TaxID=374655 RepID=A0A9W6IZ99_9HYPH|nr:AI-2E family transporter [Hansschlegelia plantiphila]GLK67417.1 AI-2E family transporter [Hansschlegelia plantiphila]